MTIEYDNSLPLHCVWNFVFRTFIQIQMVKVLNRTVYCLCAAFTALQPDTIKGSCKILGGELGWELFGCHQMLDNTKYIYFPKAMFTFIYFPV